MVVKLLLAWIFNEEVSITCLCSVLRDAELNFSQNLNTARLYEENMLRLILLAQYESVSRELFVFYSLGKLNEEGPLNIVKQWQVVKEIGDALDLVVSQIRDHS